MIKELSQGLDTMLGKRGLTSSGSQRQRVAIARAMSRNAPIVILFCSRQQNKSNRSKGYE